MANYFLKSILFIVCLLFSFSLHAREIKFGVEEVHETNFKSYESITVNGTLIVLGNLVMAEGTNLTINSGGIVIVTEDLSIGKNVSADASGYLIAESFTAPGKWGGKFKNGDKSNVFINEVHVNGSLHLLPVLDYNHSKISKLKDINKDVWDYYQKVIGGPTGGTIGFDGSATSCDGASLPSIVNKTKAWPAAYNSYSWEYLPDKINTWKPLAGYTDKSLGSIDPASIIFNIGVGTYLFRRKVVKNGTLIGEYSNTLTVTVNPIPAPIGIFHD